LLQPNEAGNTILLQFESVILFTNHTRSYTGHKK